MYIGVRSCRVEQVGSLRILANSLLLVKSQYPSVPKNRPQPLTGQCPNPSSTFAAMPMPCMTRMDFISVRCTSQTTFSQCMSVEVRPFLPDVYILSQLRKGDRGRQGI